jgi:hypothetical protein
MHARAYTRSRSREHARTTACIHTQIYEILFAFPRQEWLREGASVLRYTYKVVQIWPEQTMTCLHTNSPGHIWTTLYIACPVIPSYSVRSSKLELTAEYLHHCGLLQIKVGSISLFSPNRSYLHRTHKVVQRGSSSSRPGVQLQRKLSLYQEK